jgi:hypothetical protein
MVQAANPPADCWCRQSLTLDNALIVARPRQKPVSGCHHPMIGRIFTMFIVAVLLAVVRLNGCLALGDCLSQMPSAR